MNRRQILQYTAWVTGTAISAPFAVGFLSGCQPQQSKGPIPAQSFFSTDEMDWLSSMADIILPRTDSPSATDVGVPQMIERIVQEVFTEVEQESYKEKFALLKSFCDSSDDLEKAVILLEGKKESQEIRDAYISLKQQSFNHCVIGLSVIFVVMVIFSAVSLLSMEASVFF